MPLTGRVGQLLRDQVVLPSTGRLSSSAAGGRSTRAPIARRQPGEEVFDQERGSPETATADPVVPDGPAVPLTTSLVLRTGTSRRLVKSAECPGDDVEAPNCHREPSSVVNRPLGAAVHPPRRRMTPVLTQPSRNTTAEIHAATITGTARSSEGVPPSNAPPITHAIDARIPAPHRVPRSDSGDSSLGITVGIAPERMHSCAHGFDNTCPTTCRCSLRSQLEISRHRPPVF
jgi:hypothetical protein